MCFCRKISHVLCTEPKLLALRRKKMKNGLLKKLMLLVPMLVLVFAVQVKAQDDDMSEGVSSDDETIVSPTTDEEMSVDE